MLQLAKPSMKIHLQHNANLKVNNTLKWNAYDSFPYNSKIKRALINRDILYLAHQKRITDIVML